MRRVGLMAIVVALVVLGSVVSAGSQAQPRVSVSIRHAVPVLEVQASATDLAAGTRVRVTISGGGGESRELFSGRVGNDWYRVLPVEPCDLGGSDLPGAQYVVRIEAATGESLENPFALFPDEAKPRFLDPPFESSPRPGAKVEPGDEIGFEVTATDKTPARTWQTGVHTLTVSGPRGELESESGGRRPKPCARKSQSLTASGSYRVRDSDPAVIELCAVADDYVPNENKKCAQWYKGEVWEGTLEGTATGACKNLGIDVGFTTYAGSLQVVVDENGKVRGTFEIVTTNVCEGNTDTLSSGKQQLVAEKNERRFKIPALNSGSPLVLAITGTHASGTWTDPGGLSGSVTFQLDCKSCSRG